MKLIKWVKNRVKSLFFLPAHTEWQRDRLLEWQKEAVKLINWHDIARPTEHAKYCAVHDGGVCNCYALDQKKDFEKLLDNVEE